MSCFMVLKIDQRQNKQENKRTEYMISLSLKWNEKAERDEVKIKKEAEKDMSDFGRNPVQFGGGMCGLRGGIGSVGKR